MLLYLLCAVVYLLMCFLVVFVVESVANPCDKPSKQRSRPQAWQIEQETLEKINHTTRCSMEEVRRIMKGY
jgi:hypothetical protein